MVIKFLYKVSVVTVSVSYSSEVVACGEVSARLCHLNAHPESLGPTSKLFFKLTCFLGVLVHTAFALW